MIPLKDQELRIKSHQTAIKFTKSVFALSISFNLHTMLFSTISTFLVAALPLASAAVIKRNNNYKNVLYWVSPLVNHQRLLDYI
jgi:hypothetical protein